MTYLQGLEKTAEFFKPSVFSKTSSTCANLCKYTQRDHMGKLSASLPLDVPNADS